MGKILKINLSNREILTENLEEQYAIKLIGGSGLGAKYIHKLTGSETDPLGEENAIIFMSGPLCGTKAFSSNRFEVTTKSPLTGILAESSCGGRWSSKLKSSGYDGIIITGKSEKPIYIWIDNNKVEILNADDIWGLDPIATQEILENKTAKNAQTVCIGPSGEKMVKLSNISTDGPHSRVAGRAGVGAVMGSKKIKAIVVSGNQNFEIYNPDGLNNFYKNHAKDMIEFPKAMTFYGTSNGLEYCNDIGNLPVKNFSKYAFAGASKISGQAMAESILKKNYACGQCLIACGRTVEVSEGKYKTNGAVGGPEYETLGLLGSNLLVDDLKAIAHFNELCNKYGIDTISTGSVIGLAMECYENNLISKSELDSIDLTWGNTDAIEKVIHKIGKNEGIGKLLGEGTRKFAEKIGPPAMDFAIQVKGLEAPAHDPRSKNSHALGFATSNRGACHLQHFCYDFEDGGPTVADMGYPEPVDRYQIEGKPEFVIKFQNLSSMFDSVVCCKFVLFGGVTLNQLTETLNLITGIGIDEKEFLKTGDRIFNLKRMYNIKCGISRKDDTLPPRMLSQKRKHDGKEDILPPLNDMLKEYYKLRKWNESGIPADGKLEDLEISNYI